MKHYLYWKIMGSFKDDNGEYMDVILYGSYDQDDVNFEMEYEGDQWNEEGYEALWITADKVTTPPDSEVYPLIKPLYEDKA